jgi:hypothetical protein
VNHERQQRLALGIVLAGIETGSLPLDDERDLVRLYRWLSALFEAQPEPDRMGYTLGYTAGKVSRIS